MTKNRKSVYENPEENGMFWAMTQGVYGSKTMMCLSRDKFDSYLLGHIGGEIPEYDKDRIDRTIVRLPGTDNLVLVYNKYVEAKKIEHLRERKAECEAKGREYRDIATVTIPGIGLRLYSRAIICRVDENGEFTNLEDSDY